MYGQEIRDLYKRIPNSICRSDCGKCCTNIIQFSPSEEKRMGGYDWNGQCGHLVNGKCSVYDNRPLICRIFGTSEIMLCEGCIPDRILSEEETTEIIHEYVKYKKAEMDREQNLQ